MSRNPANIDVVRTFMTKVFNEKELGFLDTTVGEAYVQHNPRGADGKDGLRAMLQYASPKIEIVRAMSEGDLVVLHNRSAGWGDGASYVSFDVFRVLEGRIVEHWDVTPRRPPRARRHRSPDRGSTPARRRSRRPGASRRGSRPTSRPRTGASRRVPTSAIALTSAGPL
jgi:predicted SnoaL-like aldol condensation-catalyzing enzyme